MPDRVARTIVPEGATIGDALAALDAGAAGIVLAVDGGERLVGVATDGDIRRALLRGITLEQPVAAILNRTFVSVQESHSRADALDLMRARRIDAIPVLDGAGRPAAPSAIRF